MYYLDITIENKNIDLGKCFYIKLSKKKEIQLTS
jgi:hypothetical protein